MRLTVPCAALCCMCLFGCVCPQPDEPVTVQVAEPITRQQKFDQFIVAQQDWIVFLCYLLATIFMCAYTSRTGKQHAVAKQIADTLYLKMKFKFKILYRVLRYLYRRKKK